MSRKKSMNTFKKNTLAVVIASSVLSGCLSSGSDSKDNDNDGGDQSEQVSISGIAVKGLLSNATVKAYSLDGSIELTSTTTDNDGSYTLPKISHKGAILIELTTNANTRSVCDAARGCNDSGTNTDFGETYSFNDPSFKLTSILPSATMAAEQKLMVTPLTHLAAQRVIKQGFTSPAQIQRAVNDTAKLLGLAGVDINTLAPIDITNPEAVKAASQNAQMYGALMGAIATLAEDDGNATVTDVLANLANDFSTDGD